MAISLDEFFNMAQYGGQIKATHDIYTMLMEEKDPDALQEKLKNYKEETEKKFRKAALKFKMNGSQVAVDEESIEGLGNNG